MKVCNLFNRIIVSEDEWLVQFVPCVQYQRFVRGNLVKLAFVSTVAAAVSQTRRKLTFTTISCAAVNVHI